MKKIGKWIINKMDRSWVDLAFLIGNSALLGVITYYVFAGHRSANGFLVIWIVGGLLLIQAALSLFSIEMRAIESHRVRVEEYRKQMEERSKR